MEQARCVVGWHGKLPLSREFIRHHAAGPEMQAFDQWIQEGLFHTRRHLGSEWASDYQKAGAWNFLYAPPDSTRCLIGTLAPGQDKAGREFPFLLFLRVDRGAYQGTLRLLPMVASNFLRTAGRVVTQGWKGLDLEHLNAHLGTVAAPDLSEYDGWNHEYQHFLVTETLRIFWSRICGDFENPGKYELDHNLSTLLGRPGERPIAELGWGVRFPLFSGPETETYDLPLWLDLVARWTSDSAEPSLLLWNRHPTQARPCVLAAYNTPSPKLLLFALRPDKANEAWIDLVPTAADRLPDRQTAVTHLTANRKVILDNGNMPLTRFLDAATAPTDGV